MKNCDGSGREKQSLLPLLRFTTLIFVYPSYLLMIQRLCATGLGAPAETHFELQ